MPRLLDSNSFTYLLNRLWRHVDYKRKRKLFLLMILMVINSFTEVISIGAVIPFLGVLTAPEQVFLHPLSQPFIEYFRFTSPVQLIFPISILFGVLAVIAGLVRLLLAWYSIRLAFLTGSDLSIKIYYRTLFQPYSIHIERNSSEIINAIATKSHAVVYQTLIPVLTIISSLLILTTILTALFSVAYEMALIALIGFGSIYGIIMFFTRTTLLENSRRVSEGSTEVIKVLQEGLGGIRDIIIDNSQNYHCKNYKLIERQLREAQSGIEFISSSPRYLMESLGMLLIAIIAYIQIREEVEIAHVIPLLGVLALSAQRLLPVLQQLYSSVSNIQGSRASLKETIEYLDQPLSKNQNDAPDNSLPFNKQIEIDNLSFKYRGTTHLILNGITLKINKGDRVGFIGETGSGKSTLLDIVMGLLEPTNGSVKVDGNILTADRILSWQKHIAHVPQTVFLSDATIMENIAFGVNKKDIDYERVKKVAKQAKLHDFINKLPKQYQTSVGERGVKISGGQRQRIGIARALYKKADILIFDEATSALDDETEKEVMKSIYRIDKDITVLIIAHRLSTLSSCSKIVKLSNGSLISE